MNTPLLTVADLNLDSRTSRGTLKALNGISVRRATARVFGLVGETGCGKTVISLSILRLLPKSARVTNGSILFNEKESARRADERNGIPCAGAR